MSSKHSSDSEEDTSQALTASTSETSSGIIPPYECNMCDFSTDSVQGLISHKSQHFMRCFLCTFSGSSPSEFTDHLKSEHAADIDVIRSQSTVDMDCDVDEIPCAVCRCCDFMTYSVVVLENHMDLTHPETRTSAKPDLRFITKSLSEEVKKSDVSFQLFGMNHASQKEGHSETGLKTYEVNSQLNVSDAVTTESSEDVKPDVTDLLNKSSQEDNTTAFNPDFSICIKTEPVEAESDEKVSNNLDPTNHRSLSSPSSSNIIREQEPCSVVFPITTNEGETVLIQSSVQNLVSKTNDTVEDLHSLADAGKQKGKKGSMEDTGKASAKRGRQNKTGRSTKKVKVKDVRFTSADILSQQMEQQDDCLCSMCDEAFSSKLLLEIHQRKWHSDKLKTDTNGLRRDTDVDRKGKGDSTKEVVKEAPSDTNHKENFPETEKGTNEGQFGSKESKMVIAAINDLARGSSQTDHGQEQNSSTLNMSGEGYRGNVNFWKHLMMTQTGMKLLPCNLCGKGFGDSIALSKHLKTHTGEKPFKCHVCEKRFRDGSYLEVHLRTHTGEKPFKCGECDKSFSRGGHLLLHMRTHTGEKPFACGECGKSFIRNDLLHAHMRTHTEENPFKCDLCGKTFSDSNSVKRHLRTHSGEKPFPCKECGKCFARTELLNVHMRVHTGEKPYRCEMCDKRFGNNSNLQIHIRTHTGEKPFQCQQCGKHFRRSGQLHIHMRSHTGEKPFKCEECGKGISSKDQLQIHMRTHTGEKPYACSECDKSFCRNGQLQIHMRMHTGEKPFQCNQCPKGFRDRSSLNRHLKIHEREEVK